MAARMGCSDSLASSPTEPASASSTKPNSPAWASQMPVRTETPVLAPSARVSAAVTANLSSTGTAVSASTWGQACTSTRRSSCEPMATKNRPSSTSRKGLMSSSTW